MEIAARCCATAIRWWLFVDEPARCEARIRLRRWQRMFAHITEGKRRMRASGWDYKSRAKAKGLKAFGEWAELSTQWKSMIRSAQELVLKWAMVYKWRAQFMQLAAQRKRLRDGFRRIVDPEGAAKLEALERFRELLRIKRMLDRADRHHQRCYLVRRWLKLVEEKRALVAKLEKVKQVQENIWGARRFWAGLNEIMKKVRARRRAASAFLNIAPRRAINTWRAMLAHIREGRKLLVWLCMRTGTHLKPLRQILERAGPAQREEMLAQTDTLGQTPLHWAAKSGKAPIIDIILSFSGRLGNGTSAKEVLTAVDMYGLSVLHYAVRAGHLGVCSAFLVLANNLGVEIVNLVSVDGSTALHEAARKNNPAMIRTLLHHGADKAIQNKWGASPLDIALKAGGPSVDHGSPTAPAVTGAGTGAHLAVAELSSDPVQVQSARSASDGL